MQTTTNQTNNEKSSILVIDNNKISVTMINAILQNNYNLTFKDNPEDALVTIAQKKDEIDVLLMNRTMPTMDGIDLVRELKSKDFSAPIIMITAADQPEQISEGIAAGVFYYLTKPIKKNLLLSIIDSAIRERKSKKNTVITIDKIYKSLSNVQYCKSSYQTIEEIDNLSTLFASFFPDPKKIIIGIAELMFNAVEHGNLGITYDEKTKLIEEDRLFEEIQYRAKLPKNQHKKVVVTFVRDDDKFSLKLKIGDMGDGFDWSKYLKADPSRAMDNHGRGIIQANTLYFDHLEYNEKGNEVTIFITSDKELDW